MQTYLFALAALLAPLTYGYVASTDYPTFASCNPTTVSALKAYWLLTGTPRNIVKKAEENGPFTILHTSYDYKNTNNKCAYLRINDGIMNVTFVPNDGSAPYVLSYYMEQGTDATAWGRPVENDAPEFRYKWYPIYYRNGLSAIYVCSDVTGSMEPPLAAVMVSKNSYKNPFIKKYRNLLKGWGFNLKYNYGPECFPNN